LRYKERSLYKNTIIKLNNNIIAIYFYYLCLNINSIYKRAANKVKETTKRVLRYIIAISKENSAISNNSKDYKYNKREGTHAGFKGNVAISKLEKD
jgi:hypothetical protein